MKTSAEGAEEGGAVVAAPASLSFRWLQSQSVRPRWYPSQCPRADAAGTNMLASRMDQRLSLFTQFTLWPLAAAIALHAPRASTLVGSTWKLKFDIGMEPGAAMADVE